MSTNIFLQRYDKKGSERTNFSVKKKTLTESSAVTKGMK